MHLMSKEIDRKQRKEPTQMVTLVSLQVRRKEDFSSSSEGAAENDSSIYDLDSSTLI